MRKIIIALLLILVFAIPIYADVYWVDESQQNTINSSMIFYSPFGNPPMTWTPEFSTPMMGPTISMPYTYPQNLYYQQYFNYNPYYQMNRNRNYGNRNYRNYSQFYNPTTYGMYPYGQMNWNQQQRNCNNNNSNRNCYQQNWNQQQRNCSNNGDRNCYQQNQNQKQGYGYNNNRTNNGEVNQNYYGMSPEWYQPYTYGQPRNWDYYQKLYEQWNKANGKNKEGTSNGNPNMQSSDYQQWLEEHGNWYNPQGTDNEEQVSDKDNQSKEKEKSKEKESNKEQSGNKSEKK